MTKKTLADTGRMAAAIDFKHPSLVVVGHWNAAILNEPGWIAKNILGVPEGEKIDLNAVMVGNQVGPGQVAHEKQIWLFEEFGLACNGQRLEMFTRDIDNLKPLYDAVVKLTKLLPHTPTRAVGINFFVQITGDVAAITPVFETKEVFDVFGNLLTQDRTDAIDIVKDDLLELHGTGKRETALNLSRRTDFNSAEVKFNYHIQLGGMEALAAFAAANPIAHWRGHAMRLLADVYGVDDVDVAYF